MKARIQEIKQASRGKKGYYTILSRAGEKRMLKNGWQIKIADSPFESDDALIGRLLEAGYSQIKLYYSTGKIRGLYDTFAMVKE